MNQLHAMISHSKNDADYAQSLCDLLESKGLKCWIAPRNLISGEEWPAGCARGIDLASTMVLIVSDNINKSKPILSEITRALNSGKTVLPILINKDCRLADSIDFLIKPFHWLITNNNLEKDAEGIEKGILNNQDWHSVATSPSFLRKIKYESWRSILPSFIGTIGALTIVAFVVYYLWQTQLQKQEAIVNNDYMSVGYTELYEATKINDVWLLSGALYLMGDAPEANEIKLELAPLSENEPKEKLDLTKNIDKDSISNAQTFEAELAYIPRQFKVCLTRPHPKLNKKYRIEQTFKIEEKNNSNKIEFIAITKPEVSANPSSPCGT